MASPAPPSAPFASPPLRAAVKGRVIVPGDSEYDPARETGTEIAVRNA